MSLTVTFRHQFPGAQMDIAFTAPAGAVTVLFGPSGAGKSTIISVVAGLLRPDEGRVAVNGLVLADSAAGIWLRPESRQVGLVFQDARLFPHMNVATNLRYGARRAAGTAAPGDFDEMVELLGLGALLARRPGSLSGGERQRVAIGRALLARPKLLLMDEPLASLDAARKAEILPFLARLKTALRIPVLYVTHAMEEVTRLADDIVLIEAGRAVASGPLPVLSARADLQLAHREDAAAVLLTRITSHEPARRLSRLDGDGAALWVPLMAAPVGSRVRVRVPAREVILANRAPEAISLQNIVPGIVRAISADPDREAVLVEVMCGTAALLSLVTPDAVARLGLVVGGKVLVLIKSMGLEVVEG